MWIVILIAIVGFIVYSITKDYKNDVKENVTNYGGMLLKYNTLIDYLKSGGVHIQKVTTNSVLLSSQNMNWSLDYVASNLEVRMKGLMPVLGNIDKRWVFPDSYPQEKMIIEIENYLTWKMEQLKKIANNKLDQYLN